MYSFKSLYNETTTSTETITENLNDISLFYDNVGLDLKNRTRRYEYLWLCVEFYVESGDFTITKATKTWGKWISRPYGEKVDSPEGKKLSKNGYSTLVCTSGRESATSGTEVWLEIQEESVRLPWKIYWDRPLNEKNTKFVWDEYDSSLHITRQLREDNWHVFTLRKLF